MSDLNPAPFKRHLLAEIAAPGDDTFVDGPFGSSLKSYEYVNSGVRLIQLQNIGEGDWRDENKKFITPRKYNALSRHGALPGDIAIAKMAEPVARACIVPPVAEQFVVVADCIRLRVDTSKFDTGYVVRAINSPYTRREAEKKAIGSTRVRINLGVLKTVGCLAPGLAEQKAIAEVLDTIDSAICNTEAIIAKLDAVRRGTLRDLLTRGIDADGALRPPQAEAPHLYKESPLGWIPTEWESGTIVNYLDGEQGIKPGPFGSSIKKDSYSEIGFKIYGQEQVIGGHQEIGNYFVPLRKFQELKDFSVQVGDVLISLVGTIGKVLVLKDPLAPGLINPRLMRLRPNTQIANPEFVAFVIASDSFVRQVIANAGGGTMPVINKRIIAGIHVPVVPYDEQCEILKCRIAVDQRIAWEAAELEKLRAERCGLMDDLLTGRVRVTPLLAKAAQQKQGT